MFNCILKIDLYNWLLILNFCLVGVPNSIAQKSLSPNPELEIHLPHYDDILCFGTSPNERFVATGSRDLTIKIWDLGSGRTLRTLRGHKSQVVIVHFMDNENLLSVDEDGVFYSWNIKSGEKRFYYQLEDDGFSSNIYSGKVGSNSKYLALVNITSLYVFDIYNKKVVCEEYTGDSYPSYAIHPQLPVLAFVKNDVLDESAEKVLVKNFLSEQKPIEVIGPKSAFHNLTFDPSGDVLILTDRDEFKLKGFETKNYKKIWERQLERKNYSHEFCFGPNKNEIYHAVFTSLYGKFHIHENTFIESERIDFPGKNLKGMQYLDSLDLVLAVCDNSITLIGGWLNEKPPLYFDPKYTTIEDSSLNEEGEMMYRIRYKLPYQSNSISYLPMKATKFTTDKRIFSNASNPRSNSKGIMADKYTFQKILDIKDETEAIIDLKFYPTNNLLIAESIERRKLWNLNTGKLKLSIDDQEEFYYPPKRLLDMADHLKMYATYVDNRLNIYSINDELIYSKENIFEDMPLDGTSIGYLRYLKHFPKVNFMAFSETDSSLFLSTSIGISKLNLKDMNFEIRNEWNIKEELVDIIHRHDVFIYCVQSVIIANLNGKLLRIKPEENISITKLELGPDNRFLVVKGIKDRGIYEFEGKDWINIYDLEKERFLIKTSALLQERYDRRGLSPIENFYAIDSRNNTLHTADRNFFFKVDLDMDEIEKIGHSKRIFTPSIAIDEINDLIYLGYDYGKLQVYDIYYEDRLFDSTFSKQGITDVILLGTTGKIALATESGEIYIGDVKDSKSWIKMHALGEEEFITMDVNKNFIASGAISNHVSFLSGSQLYSPNEFDRQYNNPAIIIDKLGFRKGLLSSKSTSSTTPNILSKKHVYIHDIPAFTTNNKLKIKFELLNKDGLKTWQVDVNGIPYFATDNPISLIANQPIDCEIDLSEGSNRIEIYFKDEHGNSTLKESIFCRYENKASINSSRNIYLVAIGNDNYSSEFIDDLAFASKDALDLQEAFNYKPDVNYSKNENLNKGLIRIHTLLGKNWTGDSLSLVNDFLAKSGVDDVVIFYYSGHGILDEENDFYICTPDIDPNYPYKRGILLDVLLNKMAESKSRNRLLIIDACYSGIQSSSKNKMDDLILNDLFPNHQSKGINIIASSTGDETSEMRNTLQNSVFTQGLLNFLTKNNFQTSTLKKIQDGINSEVLRLTGGKQKPNIRAKNLKNNFILFQ